MHKVNLFQASSSKPMVCKIGVLRKEPPSAHVANDLSARAVDEYRTIVIGMLWNVETVCVYHSRLIRSVSLCVYISQAPVIYCSVGGRLK